MNTTWHDVNDVGKRYAGFEKFTALPALLMVGGSTQGLSLLSYSG